MLIQQQPQVSPLATYYINISIADMLCIDRARGSLCIKDDNRVDDLGGVSWAKQLEWESAKRRADATAAELSQYRKTLFTSFDPFVPVLVTLDYPLNNAVQFEVQPYQGDEEIFPVFRRFPVGYVAWVIANKYAAIYQEPAQFGVWGHDITDLRLASIILWPDNKLQVTITS